MKLDKRHTVFLVKMLADISDINKLKIETLNRINNDISKINSNIGALGIPVECIRDVHSERLNQLEDESAILSDLLEFFTKLDNGIAIKDLMESIS